MAQGRAVAETHLVGYVFGAKGQDYAHINSVQLLANGDLLASFRNLGQVMRIATTATTGTSPVT